MHATAGTHTSYIDVGPAEVRLVNGAATYTHSDGQGSPVAATDASGAVSWRERYTPFGETIDNPAANLNNKSFTGYLRDADYALLYAEAREYDPAIGRFLEPDPLREADQVNLYAYVGNDPTDKTDPMGLEKYEVGVEADGYLIMGVTYGVSATYDTETGEVATGGKFGVGFGLEGGIGGVVGRAPSGPSNNFASINAEGTVGPVSVETELMHHERQQTSGPERQNASHDVGNGNHGNGSTPNKLSDHGKGTATAKDGMKGKPGGKLGLGGHVDLQMNWEGKSQSLTKVVDWLKKLF